MPKNVHGLGKPPGYNSWVAMRQRCYNKNGRRYFRYGGRGIKVSKRWLNSFANFYKDMGPPPIGMSLDRIDNNGNYCKDNCRWATAQEQANNTCRIKTERQHKQIYRYEVCYHERAKYSYHTFPKQQAK